MTAKSDELVNELVSAAIAFGRGREPDWQTRIEDARVKLCEYIDEVEGLEEDSGSYDSLIPDWANEPKQRWIPVSEKLPEETGLYLVWQDGSFAVGYRVLYYSAGRSYLDFMWSIVTHWMPLPARPEVQE